jgi:hypothetical protein
MTRAWLLRMNPLDVDRVPVALRTGEISVGWGKAQGLTDPSLSRWRFRSILIDAYHADAPDLRRAGGSSARWAWATSCSCPTGSASIWHASPAPPRMTPIRRPSATPTAVLSSG